MNRYIIYIILICISLTSCKKSIKDIIADTEDATFVVYTYNSFGSPQGIGSGFFIDDKGIGITNYHVLDGAIKASIKNSDGSEYEIDKVLASDKDWDILKFSIKNPERKSFKTLDFRNREMEKGDIVYNISNPLGLESTVSEGIVSSLREDGQHGKTVQITAPISPGSSGSALLDKQGKVFAVATFLKEGGQNLNFGVSITSERIADLQKNDFVENNLRFNKNENLIILNVPSQKGSDIILNAIEFTPSATIGYFTYTNLQLGFGKSMAIWTNTDSKAGEVFTIEDNDTSRKYYIQSSTIGTDRGAGASVPLASSYSFKVFFEPVPKDISNISVYEGNKLSSWSFLNIDLSKYRNMAVHIDRNKYQKEYAYSIMQQGGTAEAENIMRSYLKENPSDIEALNALGIIEYVRDNNAEAISYFSRAIDCDPMNDVAYYNRYSILIEQGRKEEALADINQAIICDPNQIDYYNNRAALLVNLERFEEALSDLNRLAKDDDFKYYFTTYTYRAMCYFVLGDNKKACDDIYKAYNLTSNKEDEQLLEDMWKKCGCR